MTGFREGLDKCMPIRDKAIRDYVSNSQGCHLMLRMSPQLVAGRQQQENRSLYTSLISYIFPLKQLLLLVTARDKTLGYMDFCQE